MKHYNFIQIVMPNGFILDYCKTDFEQYDTEFEHISENIILNTEEPEKSFIYETNNRGEIINKEFIKYYCYD